MASYCTKPCSASKGIHLLVHACADWVYRLLSQAAAQISLSRLDQLTREFRSLGYPAGAVDLALHCASVWDVEGKGLAWWSEGSPANDPRQAYFEKREDCYKTITTLLEATETDIDQAISQQNTSARKSPTLPCSWRCEAEMPSCKGQDLESQRQALFQRAYGSRDEPFNFHIYDWLMEKRRTDELLNVSVSSGPDLISRLRCGIGPITIRGALPHARHPLLGALRLALAVLRAQRSVFPSCSSPVHFGKLDRVGHRMFCVPAMQSSSKDLDLAWISESVSNICP